MWIANRWQDYQVMDTSAGEKLERWDKYTLVRPDPQVIWNTEKTNIGWRKKNGHYHRSAKGGGEWEFFNLPEEWTIQYTLPFGDPACKELTATQVQEASVYQIAENGGAGSGLAENGDVSSHFAEKGGASSGHVKNNNVPSTPEGSARRKATTSSQALEDGTLTFHLKPFSFKHTGLFPEQAVNWDWFSTLIKEANRPIKVLNLFAYTGGATLAAAAAGANVTHVDAAKGMVSWARENAISSGLEQAPIRWLVDDCGKFVEREIRRGNKYDAIIMDPPSYGRGPKGEIWKIEESIFPFLQLTSQILSDDPLFVLLNSYTTGLQPAVLTYMMSTVFASKFGGKVESQEIGVPVTDTGLVLPCGASGRWTK